MSEQAFSFEQASLFWRCLPEQIVIHQESKQGKIQGSPQHTVLLGGGNVTKPKWNLSPIHHSQDPKLSRMRASKHFPVYCHHGKDAWMATECLQSDFWIVLFWRKEKAVDKTMTHSVIFQSKQCPKVSPTNGTVHPDKKMCICSEQDHRCSTKGSKHNGFVQIG